MKPMIAQFNSNLMIRTDESNDFAHHTLTVRIPEIIADIQERNPDYDPAIHRALENLSQSIRNDDPFPAVELFAPDYANWLTACQERQGETWLQTAWFFAETYFYRQVVRCVRWWETGRDPFAPNKVEEYASDALWQMLDVALEAQGAPDEKLVEAISRALWGNRIDLSYAPSREHGTTINSDDLLVNDTAETVEHLLNRGNGRGAVHIIADNAGTELTMDLVLADVLLENAASEVILHLKMHPTFVSDALPGDVWKFVDMLESRGGQYATFGGRLRAAFYTGRLRLMPDFFWNSPYLLWEMPANLQQGFSAAKLVIIKGDANYRRMVGDAIWPEDTPYGEIVGYFPAPLLALRTLKSDPIVGLAPGTAARLDGVDERWRVNGRRGVIQLAL